MTASTNPDENFHIPKDAGSAEPMGFVYDDPSAPPQAESTYIPEREFVLMPLFRRLGELLGISRQTAIEHIDEPTPEALRVEASTAHEKASLSHEEPNFAEVADVQLVQEPANEWAELQASEPLPDVVSEVAEPVALQAAASEPEAYAQVYEPLEEVEAASAHFEPLPEYEPAPQAEAPTRRSPVAEVAARSAQPVAQPQRKRPAARRPDEIDEAIAALREAASKISTAISQAVEWLSAKENELVRKAERSLAPAPKTRRIQRPPVKNQQSTPATEAEVAASSSSLTPETPAIPKWEPLQFPGLQREVAWRQQAESAPAEQPLSKPQPAHQSTYSVAVKQRPALVRPRPRVPFWKRIDWAAQFTPKRVAVLGGVTMAMLLVAGVTLARRPASDVLPPQTHTIQPGGVTVSTHPTSATTSPALQPSRAASRALRQAPAAPHRAKRAAAYDEEPDVVTHYYKQKPSPTKQSTVAGVKHYSDLN